MNKIVKNDGKQLTEILKLDAGTLRHQGNYRFTATINGDEVNIHTEPVDESNEEIRITEVRVGREYYEFCEWCGELLPESEMRKEERLGYLCDRCQNGIASRGESLTYEN